MRLNTVNPATGEKLTSYVSFSKGQLDKTVLASDKASSSWRLLSMKERASRFFDVAKVLRKNQEKYATLMTKEMGKPIKESLAEIEKCAWLCEYYAQNAERFLENEKVETEHSESFIQFDPLGKILCVMPWNFPFWQVFRFGVPALCVGNTIMLKHSSVTLGCSLEIEKLFQDILGKDVVKTVITDGKGVNYLLDKVQGVSLTGSVATGKVVAQEAGKRLKKFVLELGGSDPYIVLKDADVKLSCEDAMKGRFINTGQSCIAAKRFIIEKERFDEFNDRILASMKTLKIGNPLDKSTDIGPLARKEFVKELQNKIATSVKQGGKILYKADIPKEGFYVAPTFLTVKQDNILFKEETFGPVFASMKVNNEKEAIQEANNSEFGLGAALWTRNINKARELAKQLEVGTVAINNFVKSDPRLPFGGVKNSGIGRELSRYGLLEFCNIKSVVIN